MASVLCTTTIYSQQLAFPEAAGWGRYAQGARKSSSPTVYHVTNLNDSGSGSLRDAVSQSNRIIVFDVAGVIKINSRIVFKSNLYVAGQTAPGEGVTVYGNGVSFSGSDNIICRYMRFRMGHNGDSGKDCAGVANGYNMIFDHCSFSWGLDETFSINAFGLAGNITLQNCIIGQGLMTHSAGGLMQADSITLYRNLYIDNSTRNNKVKGTNQYANNVVYNWSNGCYIMGGDSEGSSYCNIQSNLFINGPAKGGNALGGGNSNFHFYGDDNWQDSNMDGVFDPQLNTSDGGGDRVSTPYNYPALELYKGNELLSRNIPTVGASLPYRDQADCYMIDELMSFGKSGALISNEENLAIGSPSTWAWFTGYKKSDKDGDGMPDDWETTNGTDPNKADATVKAANGYLNIENYINSITVEDRDYFLRAPITLTQSKSTTSTMTITWRDYTYEEDGFEVSYAEDGSSSYKVAGKTAPNATSYVLNGLKDGTFYNVRVRAFGNDTYSEYTTGKFSTKPVEANVIDIDSYQPDLTNVANGMVNSTNAAPWKEGRAVKEGDKLLIDASANRVLIVNEAISPAAIVVKGDARTTLTSNAAIGGSCSINKDGLGTLVLNGTTANTYTGATVLHDGELQFNTIANGGQASAIGASKNFAQNWVFDGGTYNYTGANASTDRSAQIKSESTLKVGTSGKTLTMNGSLEGSSNLMIDGPGQVSVGTKNFFSYTGTTKIKGGTLYLSTVDIAKAGIGKSSKLILAGGTLKTKGESNNYETYQFPIEVEEGTYSYFAPNRNCYTKNTITGAGTLEYDIPYLREYFDANIENFTGQIVANGIGTDSWGSLFLSQGSFNMPATRVTLKGNTKMCMWTTNGNGKIGGLSGDAGTYLNASSKSTNTSVCNWTIGGANSDETFNGIITNNCCAKGYNSASNNITKVGTGIWRLTGKNTYVGTTTVNGGKLIVNGNNSGTGKYIVNADGTLGGKGTVAGAVTVAANGCVEAGDTLVNASTLKLTSSLTMSSGSILQVNATSTGKTNYVAVTGAFTNNGAILSLSIDTTTGAIANGTEFKVFTAGSVAGTGFTDIQPAQPADGMTWDTSRLNTEGIITARISPTAISPSPVSSPSPLSCDKSHDLYTLSGLKTTTHTKGIVITNGKKIIIK